jgi:hypothetical protein
MARDAELGVVPVEGEAEEIQVPAEPTGEGSAVKAYFEPLFAGTGGIDSWLGDETPREVFDRLAQLPDEPLSSSQLGQLLILSHEAAPSEGFFTYYWLRVPTTHPYDVTIHGVRDSAFDRTWTEGNEIRSLAHLRWGLYRFYVDALLYFGNVRSAYRSLRDKTEEELERFFAGRRIDTEGLSKRGPALGLEPISKDDRYLVAEYACKSLDDTGEGSELERAALEAYRAHVGTEELRSFRWTSC